jgi:uncharacterized membrane protein
VEERPIRSRQPPGVVYVRDETDLGRLLGLSDGVFAFALTLLVLTLAVPSVFVNSNWTPSHQDSVLAGALNGDYTIFVGYAFAFTMIAVWWMNHNRTFRYIYRYDNVLVWLNFAVLIEISIMPFVLGVFVHYAGAPIAVGLFAAIQAATGLTLNAMWRYSNKGDRLVHPDFDPKVAQDIAKWGTVPALLFLASIPVAFVSVNATYFVWALTLFSRRYVRQMGG